MNTARPTILVLALAFTFGVHSLPASETLSARPPQELSGTRGKFDFIKIDSTRHRLLACHAGNGSLDVIDLPTGKLIESVHTGNAQGVAVDARRHRYLVSVSKPPSLAIVDSDKLTVLAQIPLPHPADLAAYREKSNRIFVCNDEQPEMWIIDPQELTVTATLKLPGSGLEDLGFGGQEAFLYQCLKDSSQLAKIDPDAKTVVTLWPTTPADKPHGLALVPGTDSALIVGANGKLVLMNLTTGQVMTSTDVSPRVDEIAYDPQAGRVYCASGLGIISVAELKDRKLSSLPPVASQKGAHSIAVDPTTGTVWIAFADANNRAFVQAFERK